MPEVGRVTPVVPETVSVVAKLPEMVRVEAALLAIPVPPYAGPMTEPFQAPEEMVAPLMVPAQAKAPVELVMVQPVEADPPPMRISPVAVLLRLRAPVPLASIDKATAESPPVAARVTPLPAAALARVSSLTAEATESRMRSSFPEESARYPKSAKRGVVRVGEVAKTATPVPVSSDRELSRAAEAPVEERLEEASVNTTLDAVKSGRLMTLDPESMTMLPVAAPPRVRVFMSMEVRVGVP